MDQKIPYQSMDQLEGEVDLAPYEDTKGACNFSIFVEKLVME